MGVEVQNVNDIEGLRLLMDRLRDAYEGDPEVGHGMEDALMRRVLRLTVEGHPQVAAFATEVLKAQDWDVSRWYA